MDLKKDITVGLKGFGMGAANVVPGVSGGTIALLTGIYKEIVDVLSSLTAKDTWKSLFKGDFKKFWSLVHGRFLVALFVGVILSILTLAKFITDVALSQYPVATWAFFFGLIVCSTVFMLKEIKGWKVLDALWIAIGIGMGLAVSLLTPSQTPDSLPFIFFCGAVSICTMILPGISGSFVLQIMGKYEYIMSAITIGQFNWPVVIAFGLGCIVGILAFARLLKWLLARAEKQTLLVLIGFVMGSLLKIWPWNNVPASSDPHVLQAVIWGLAGVALVLVLELLGSRKSKA